MKHETSHNKKEMFSIGDTTSESGSSGGNVKLPENLDLHAKLPKQLDLHEVDYAGLSLKTGLSNGTHESVYPISAYKTSESGHTCNIHLAYSKTNSESNQAQQLNGILAHGDQTKLVKERIRQKILTKKRHASKKKSTNVSIKTRETRRQIHDHSKHCEGKHKSLEETSNNNTQDCESMETEDTNYVPDELGDEFKKVTRNSCEKNDSDSKQFQSCPKSAASFHSLSEYNKRLKEMHCAFPCTTYPNKYPAVPCDEEMTENVKIETEEESFHEISDDNSSVVTMVTALNNINNQQGYICSFCGKNIKTKRGHRRHELIHSDNDKKRRECHVCNKKFVDKFHFLGHMNTHTANKPFKCEKCKLQYAYKASYKRHLEVCKTSAAKTFKCLICPCIFERKDVLSDHMKGKHEKSVDQYRCEICNKGFRYRSSKSNHNKKHHQ